MHRSPRLVDVVEVDGYLDYRDREFEGVVDEGCDVYGLRLISLGTYVADLGNLATGIKVEVAEWGGFLFLSVLGSCISSIIISLQVSASCITESVEACI